MSALEDLLEERVRAVVDERLERLEHRSRFVSRAKLAELLGLTERQVRGLRERGLPGRRIGKLVLFDVEEAERWIARYPVS